MNKSATNFEVKNDGSKVVAIEGKSNKKKILELTHEHQNLEPLQNSGTTSNSSL